MKRRYLSLEPIIPWLKQARPIEWDHVFGRSAGLEVEIGFGLGDFLVRKARENPEKDIVGIEPAWVLVRRALRKIAVSGVKNAGVIQTDARTAFERLFKENSLCSIYALFPCPWPKKKHAKYRLFSNAFLRLLNSRIIDGGKILIVTDHQSYHDWIISQLSGTGFEVHPGRVSPRFSTKYERKWQELGQRQFYELRMIKRQHVHIHIKEDVVLITYRVAHFDPKNFHPTGGRGLIVVEFKEILYDPDRQKAMIRSVVGEDTLIQDFWIEIVRGEKGWAIRPAKGCGIVPTAGVQKALNLVRDAAEE